MLDNKEFYQMNFTLNRAIICHNLYPEILKFHSNSIKVHLLVPEKDHTAVGVVVLQAGEDGSSPDESYAIHWI